jgi:hypothetical protein
LGDTYGTVAAALASAELPKEIDPRSWRNKRAADPARVTGEAGYKAYADALEEQLRPLRRNAFDNYKASSDAAAAGGVAGEWRERAFKEHERLGKEYGYTDAPPETPPAAPSTAGTALNENSQ